MDIKERIERANDAAVHCVIDADPVWVDINTNTYLPTVSIAEHGFTFI